MSSDTYTQNRKILYVDDEPNLLSSFRSLMRGENCEIHLLEKSEIIEDYLRLHGPFAVVLSDQRMPVVDGVKVLQTVAENYPETVRIMITGYADFDDTLRAINVGKISHYINKPWDDNSLKQLLRSSLEKYNLYGENRYLLSELNIKNQLLTELLNGTTSGTVRLLSDLIGYINPEANAQTMRVRQLGRVFLNKLTTLDSLERWEIESAFDLFNIGVAVLPSWIQVTLNKDGLASAERFPEAKNHQLLGAALIENIPKFKNVARIIRLCKKDFDGQGEPIHEKISRTDLPLGSRILRILIDVDKLILQNTRGSDIYKRLSQSNNVYDTEILNMFFGTERQQQTQNEIEKSVTVDELNEGMVTLQDIVTSKGLCLIKTNAVLTATIINMVLQWQKTDPVKQPIKVKLIQS